MQRSLTQQTDLQQTKRLEIKQVCSRHYDNTSLRLLFSDCIQIDMLWHGLKKNQARLSEQWNGGADHYPNQHHTHNWVQVNYPVVLVVGVLNDGGGGRVAVGKGLIARVVVLKI